MTKLFPFRYFLVQKKEMAKIMLCINLSS